jgi:parallel beta-helix repeat protein
MKTSYIAITIISILLLTNITSAAVLTLKNAENIRTFNPFNFDDMYTTIYVDDDNIFGPWDGTMQNPFRFIQDGINNSEDGFIIKVLDGKYTEDIIIDKSVHLSGEDQEKTIIDATGDKRGILVIKDDVNISGFTIKNVYTDWWDCSAVTIKADNVSVVNNKIYNNKRAILLYNTTGTTVMNNFFSYNHIIIIENSNNNRFCHNILIRNSILIQNSNNNKIYSNYIEGEYWTNGIYLEHSSNNCIYYNTIKNCSEGIELYSVYKERNTGSNRNNICYNHLENIQFWGIFIERGISNKIHHNNFVKCRIKAFIIDGFFNRWYRNYWGRPRLLPKRIIGFSSLIIGRFDLFPKFFPNKI